MGGNRIVVVAQAGDVAGDGVARHCESFVHGAPVGDAAGQGGHYGSESTLWFVPKHDIVMVAGFSHKTWDHSSRGWEPVKEIRCYNNRFPHMHPRGHLTPNSLLSTQTLCTQSRN